MNSYLGEEIIINSHHQNGTGRVFSFFFLTFVTRLQQVPVVHGLKLGMDIHNARTINGKTSENY